MRQKNVFFDNNPQYIFITYGYSRDDDDAATFLSYISSSITWYRVVKIKVKGYVYVIFDHVANPLPIDHS